MRFNKLVPELSVSDFNRSLEFYTKILGFKINYTREKFAFLSLQGSQLMIEETNNHWSTAELKHPFGRGINFQIEVKIITPLLKSLNKEKYILFRQPKDVWYKQNNNLLGCREFLVQDPDGYLLRFSQNIGAKKLR